jgi:UDP-N-acetylglucosamine--N-acetylmuramyl-(pentapeptide) pyrophosphoryl-undecaprenol N-acetylglucosamine transferase
MEADLIKRAGMSFNTIPAAGVHGVGLRSLPGNLIQLARGFIKSRKILSTFRPDVLFFTGGYIAVPMALAGVRLPSLLYVPDIEPGLALKSIARFADRIAVTAIESIQFFSQPEKITVTGYPTRPKLSGWSKTKAIETLKLRSDLPVLLVFGGSKGARSINQSLLPILPELLKHMQIVHITGQLDWPKIETVLNNLHDETLEHDILSRYHAFPYLHDEMGAALCMADLVVSRAGASTLGEFPMFGIPAVLVPYPHAWRYQQVNAEYLVNHGAAIIVNDEDLPDQLLPVVKDLMNNPNRRREMGQAMRKMGKPEAALRIYQILQSLITKRDLKGSQT